MVIGGDGGEKVEDDRTTMAMAEAAIKGGANNVSSERTQLPSGASAISSANPDAHASG